MLPVPVFTTDKPRLLDLFCKAGGASKGYMNAGFHVTGVDIEHQKHYIGDEFIQADALEYIAEYGHLFDVIHASPPCQGYSETRHIHKSKGIEHPKLIPAMREILQSQGKPYVIENVPGARRELVNPLLLCGTMFNLKVIRHRFFECQPAMQFGPYSCNHYARTGKRGQYDNGQGGFVTVVGHNFNVEVAKTAMGIDWMTGDELREAIPPAYTEFIGKHFIATLGLS